MPEPRADDGHPDHLVLRRGCGGAAEARPDNLRSPTRTSTFEAGFDFPVHAHRETIADLKDIDSLCSIHDTGSSRVLVEPECTASEDGGYCHTDERSGAMRRRKHKSSVR